MDNDGGYLYRRVVRECFLRGSIKGWGGVSGLKVIRRSVDSGLVVCFILFFSWFGISGCNLS